MWLRLSLRDFVIVSSLDVDLAAGFSVLTGETGAGKSILIDALALALGGRGDASVVREGASKADISAEFTTDSAVPHSPQNLAPGEFSLPHLAQRFANGVPHSVQNFAPSALSTLHCLHCTGREARF